MLRLPAIAGLLALCCLLVGGEVLASTTLRLGHEHPTSSVQHLGLLRFAQLVVAKTGGNVKIDIYGGGSITDEPGLASGIRGGTVDMALLATGNVTRFNPDYMVFDLPYLFRDYAHLDRTLHGEIGNNMADRLESNGIRVLSYWDSGFRHFMNSVRPIKGPEDIRGLILRTPNWVGITEIEDVLGANPRLVELGDVNKAITAGDIQGLEGPVFVARSLRLYETQKFLTLDGHAYSPMILAVSPRKFKNMSGVYKKALAEAAEEAGFYVRRLIRDQYEADIRYLEEHGVQVIRVTDKTPWIEATKPVYERLASRLNNKLIAKIRAL